ncbi:MAG: DUF58 domain-containing protein [Emcibacter sp.]|nr:DUF58 domain-containing protein [Emcibacter sp.]
MSIVSVRMTNNFAQEKLRVDFQIGNQTENITAVTLLNRTSSFVCQPTEAGMFIEVPAQKRGKFHLGIFGFVSFYPFGLFRRTKYRENFRDASAVVYPEFEGAWPLSRHVMGRGNQSLSEKDNFEGLKEYAAGDSLADIAWKASARGQGVMTKQFEGTGILEEFILSLDIVPENDGEKKLSQLAVWAVQLNRQGRNFGLDLKGLTIASATGERHLVKILTALAFCGDRP